MPATIGTNHSQLISHQEAATVAAVATAATVCWQADEADSSL